MTAGINMVHVPYKGAALALTDVIGAHVDSMFISAPGATPAATIARLQNAIAKALGTPDVRERYMALSLDPAASTAQDYAAYLRDDLVRWRKVVAAAKLSPQ